MRIHNYIKTIYDSIKIISALVILVSIFNSEYFVKLKPAHAETPETQFRTLIEKARSHESLSRDEVDTVESLAKLRILRNAVYAGHGYRFNSPDLGSYFSQYKWFKPEHPDVKDRLTETDRANLEKITWREFSLQLREKLMSGKVKNEGLSKSEKKLIGIWNDAPVLAAGWGNSWQFFPNGKVLYRYNTMDCDERNILKPGTWQLEGTTLSVSFTTLGYLRGGEMVEATGSCASDQELIHALPTLQKMEETETQTFTGVKPLFDAEFERDIIKLDEKRYWKLNVDPWDY
ncbi:MAG: YARHG domain-containing protein [Spirochaetota bacterium]